MSEEKDEMIGCSYMIVALAIAFVIIYSIIKYWN